MGDVSSKRLVTLVPLERIPRDQGGCNLVAEVIR